MSTTYAGNGNAAVDGPTLNLTNQLSFILPLIADLGAVATTKTVSLTSGQNSGGILVAAGAGTLALTQFSEAGLTTLFASYPQTLNAADQATALAVLASAGMLGA